jgi:hypothetical protein
MFAYPYLDTGEIKNVPGFQTLPQQPVTARAELLFPEKCTRKNG